MTVNIFYIIVKYFISENIMINMFKEVSDVLQQEKLRDQTEQHTILEKLEIQNKTQHSDILTFTYNNACIRNKLSSNNTGDLLSKLVLALKFSYYKIKK